MKNLKKLFAVVLAVAMCFSLMAVASAASIEDYSDASSITYKEAVNVLTAAGVLQGSAGEFDPTGTFTREMAAKVVTYIMIGSTAADRLKTSTSTFSDVAADRWSAPYIEYCTARGVINGDGTGKFNPTASISGTTFAKLLLGAAGYGKNGEYVGSNWEINVLTEAIALKILTLDVDYSAPATREQVAQYALNALPLRLHVYDKTTEEYKPTATPSYLYDKLGLTLEPGVLNGVTGSYWVLKGDRLGFYGDQRIIATGTDGRNISAYTTLGGFFYKATLASTVAYYYNGNPVTVWTPAASVPIGHVVINGEVYLTTAAITAASTTAADAITEGAPAGGLPINKTGLVVNFISTNEDSKAEAVSIIEKRVAKVGAVPTVDAFGSVTIPGVTGSPFAAKTVEYPADLAKGDYVLYYAGQAGVTYIEKAEKVTGQVTGWTDATVDTVTIAGTAHGETALAGKTFTLSTFVSNAGNFGVAATAWLDNNGNIIALDVDDVALTANYLLVTASEGAVNRVASVVKADGTTAVVSLGFVGISATALPVDDTIYSYTVGENGAYNLALPNGTTAVAAAANGIILSKANFNTTLIGDGNTAFVISNTIFSGIPGTYRVVKGVANLPASTGITGATGYAVSVNGVAKVVFVTAAVGSYSGAPSLVYFINPASYTTTYPIPGVANYTFKAIVDGVQKDVTTSVAPTGAADTIATSTAVSKLVIAKYDSNGVIVDVDPITNGTEATFGTAAAAPNDIQPGANGTVKLGANYFTYTDTTTVFYINPIFFTVSESSPEAILVDIDDSYIAQFTASPADAADVVSAIYIVANP